MGRRTAVAACATALSALGAAAPAGATDAQVKATILHGINAINHERVVPLSTDLLVIRTTLSTETATSPKMKTAKALALSGFHYAQVAADAQAQAAQDITDAHVGSADYDPSKLDDAQSQLGVAAKNQTAGVKLLRQAGKLIGYTGQIK